MINFKNAFIKYELTILIMLKQFFLFLFFYSVAIFYTILSSLLIIYQAKFFFFKKKKKVNGILSYLLVGAIISITVIARIKYDDLGFVEHCTQDIDAVKTLKQPMATPHVTKPMATLNAINNLTEKQCLLQGPANTARYQRLIIATTRYDYCGQLGYKLNADSSFSICGTKKRLMYDISQDDYIEL